MQCKDERPLREPKLVGGWLIKSSKTRQDMPQKRRERPILATAAAACTLLAVLPTALDLVKRTHTCSP